MAISCIISISCIMRHDCYIAISCIISGMIGKSCTKWYVIKILCTNQYMITISYTNWYIFTITCIIISWLDSIGYLKFSQYMKNIMFKVVYVHLCHIEQCEGHLNSSLVLLPAHKFIIHELKIQSFSFCTVLGHFKVFILSNLIPKVMCH